MATILNIKLCKNEIKTKARAKRKTDANENMIAKGDKNGLSLRLAT